MKTIFIFLVAITLAGCANRASVAGGNHDCCGLTRAQWQTYDERAAEAVTNLGAWRRVGAKMPLGVQPTAHSDLFGTTNSSDGVRPPTEVTVDVPIGNSVKGCSVVIVEFEHPEGKIKKMSATDVYYN